MLKPQFINSSTSLLRADLELNISRLPRQSFDERLASERWP